MIIAQRSASLNYGTDPVAQSLRSVVASSAASIAVETGLALRGDAPLDLVALYPALYAPAHTPAVLSRAMRALAFRLSVLSSAAAAMLIYLHH